MSTPRAAPTLDHIDREHLLDLARAVYLQEYDTQEHDDAFNAFCFAAEHAMNPDQRDEWDEWSLKATWDEIISEALRILGLCLQLP